MTMSEGRHQEWKLEERTGTRLLASNEGEGPAWLFTSPVDHSLTVLPSYPRSTWISLLPDSACVSSLSIPGTHNSLATRGSLRACHSRSCSIAYQLQSGLRFLDLRFSAVNDPVREGSRMLQAYHGPVDMGVSARETLETVYGFLRENGREMVIISVKEEGRSTDFADLFHALIASHPELWYTESTWPTLGQVRGKAVLFCRYDHSSGKGLHTHYWPNSERAVWETVVGEKPLRVQDWYNVSGQWSLSEKLRLAMSLFPSFSSPSSSAAAAAVSSPASTVSPVCDSVASSSSCTPTVDCMPIAAVPERLQGTAINFLSASALITTFPCFFAKGLSWCGGVGMNELVMRRLLTLRAQEIETRAERSHCGMILLLDFFDQPPGVVELMIERNF